MTSPKIRIGLTMIAKNEAHCIGRCLESVFKTGLVDYCKVVDTGSTDETKKVVEYMLHKYNISGEITNHAFTDFGECRNIALEGLEEFCEYAFWIDADEVFYTPYGANIDSFKTALPNYDAVYIRAIDGSIGFYRTSFFKLSKGIKWNGKVHEYVAGIDQTKTVVFNQFHINVFQDGHSWTTNRKAKLRNYLELLIAQHQIEPTEPRWVYFIADTYRNAQEPNFDKMAMDWYRKRMDMDGGNIEEVYVSKVMLASLQRKLNGTMDIALLESCDGVFDRGEHLLTLANYYQSSKQYEKSYEYSKRLIKYFWNTPTQSGMMIDIEAYYWIMPITHAINCFCLGKKQEAEFAIDYAVRAQEGFVKRKESRESIQQLCSQIQQMK